MALTGPAAVELRHRSMKDYPTEAALFRGNRRFELLGLIGAGGMGVVLEAFDREHRCRVALKLLPTLSPKAIVRFKNEFRSLQGIHHPNLVGLGELIEDDGRLFFTMELVVGVDLLAYVHGSSSAQVRSRLRSGATTRIDSEPVVSGLDCRSAGVPTDVRVAPGRGPDQHRLRSAFAQLTEALMCLHGCRKVHRDVKPSNVLVTDPGRLVLLDFGLVVEAGRAGERSGSGTIPYMSPEQAAGVPVHPASDWYSVGVLLYEALTGHLPFGPHAAEILARQQSEDAPAPSSVTGDVPADLDDLCRRLLRRDPRARAGGADLLAVLAPGGATLSLPPEPAPQPFVGRGAELARLREALSGLAREPLAVAVDGESGVGKTALVGAFLAQTARSPLPERPLVFCGRCSQREAIPFKACDGIAEDLAEHLAGLEAAGDERLQPGRPLREAAAAAALAFPVFNRWTRPLDEAAARPGDPLFQRQLAFQGVRKLLAAIARDATIILYVDDWQWVDPDSVSLLSFALAPPDAPALLLLLVGRGGPGGAPLPCPFLRIQLANLEPPDAELLTRQLLHVPADRLPSVARAIAGESMGHPLFILELVRQAGGLPGPPRLDEAIAARFTALDPGLRRVVELLALAAAPLELSVLCDALERAGQPLSWARLSGVLACLTEQNLARSEGLRARDLVSCFHHRVACAIAARVPEPDRRRCHEALAWAIERTDAPDLEALADHWRRAGDHRRAAGFARKAADRAVAALAFGRAADLYRECLELSVAGPERDEIQRRLGEVLGHLGRGREAADAYLAAGASAAPDQQLELWRLAADQLFRCGYVDEAVSLIGRVFDVLGLALPRSPRHALLWLAIRRAQIRLRGTSFRAPAPGPLPARSLARVDASWTVAIGLSMVDNLWGASVQSRHLLLALALGEPFRVLRAVAAEAGYQAAPGLRSKRSVDRLLARADDLARDLADPYAFGFVHLARCFACYLHSDFEGARRAGAAAESIFEQRPVMASWELASVRMLSLASHFFSGELEVIHRRVPALIREAEERGDRYTAAAFRIALCNCAWLVSDDDAEARRNLELAGQTWSQQGVHLREAWSLIARCHVDLYQGHPEAAYQNLQQSWPQLRRSLLLATAQLRIDLRWLRARAALAVAHRDPGRGAPLLADAERCAAELASERPRWATAVSDLVLAGVLAVRGQPEEAIQRRARALAGAQACGLGIVTRAIGVHTGDPSLGTFAPEVTRPDRWAEMIAPALGRLPAVP
jgi:hypothetical protein